MGFQVNDYVTIRNQSNIYIITEINDKWASLKGYTHRIFTKALLDDLVIVNEAEVLKEKNYCEKVVNNFKKALSLRSNKRLLYGTILHIDGDEEYLKSCMQLYKEMNIYANGIYLKEEKIKDKIEELVLKLTPDIVVITGHDVYNGKGIKSLENYLNTIHYMEAVRLIRRHFNTEAVTIIVGACGSHFEALIASGANFSSSPKRINIHTYDPAIIAIKVATTSSNQIIDFDQTLKYIENKKDAFGGIETKGKMKLLL